jgi:predicted small lipoprotein YifL
MRRVLGAVAVLGMLALSGCGTSDPLPTLPPTPSSTPVFASEEEALAAAEEAYAAYSEASDLIASEGGSNPERITSHVTKDRLADELRGFKTLSDAGLRIEGSASFDVLGLQRYEEISGEAEVAFYICWDTTAARVISATGEDVTPPDRPDRLVLEIVMTTVNGDLPLVLESDEEWPSGSC